MRPNSGRIEPGHEVEVSGKCSASLNTSLPRMELLTSTVLLQAMKQEPPIDARCRDKFLVQSVTITGDKEFTGVPQIVC